MRNKPRNLELMEMLHPRMCFNNNQKKIFSDAKNGFDGECLSDAMIDPYLENCIIINDLCLQANRFCQIDKLIIAPSQIYLLEIKNYGGTFIYKDKKFFNHNMVERDNPFLQLERTEQQFRMFTRAFNFPLCARIVTMNGTFQLHGSNLEMPLIQRGQLERFINYVASDRKSLTHSHYELVRYLRESHQDENKYEQLMPYDFSELKRGIFCRECEEKMTIQTRKKFVCTHCNISLTKQQVVKRAVAELNILAGPQKARPKLIQEWTENKIHIRNIERALHRLKKNEELQIIPGLESNSGAAKPG